MEGNIKKRYDENFWGYRQFDFGNGFVVHEYILVERPNVKPRTMKLLQENIWVYINTIYIYK